MAKLLSRSAWAKFPDYFVKIAFFLAQKVFLSAFLVKIQNQLLKIDPCAKFQIFQILNIDFERFFPEYHHAKFGGN